MTRNRSNTLASFVLDNSLLLLAGTVAAVAWANLDLTSYDRLAHPSHFWINDVGMVFFFALAAKEVLEATLPGGALASPRRALSPLAAAIGGMAAPAAIYVALASTIGPAHLTRGWAIPCATDIAFSAMIARLIFPAGPRRCSLSSCGLDLRTRAFRSNKWDRAPTMFSQHSSSESRSAFCCAPASRAPPGHTSRQGSTLRPADRRHRGRDWLHGLAVFCDSRLSGGNGTGRDRDGRSPEFRRGATRRRRLTGFEGTKVNAAPIHRCRRYSLGGAPPGLRVGVKPHPLP